MAAVAGPTQEGSGVLTPAPRSLSSFWKPEQVSPKSQSAISCGERSTSILANKIEANAHLPSLAEGFVSGELMLDDLCQYFARYAHLYTIGIDVNAVCNLACQYCYLDQYNLKSAPIYADLKYVNEFLEQVIAQGLDLVALVGKEPFADERGIELLQFLDQLLATGRQFRFGVVTNGTLADRFFDRLPRSISYIDISLDGTASVNDLLRGQRTFARAAVNARLLVDLGFPVWISSVLHRGNNDPRILREFISVLVEEYGCTRFYFSPVRNFTGTVNNLLLSYEEISALQSSLVDLSADISGVDVIILDHPYEAVWRDYFWPVGKGCPSRLMDIAVDAYGNVLEKLAAHCYRKLDIFPHGPWGTCRVDARGEYLPDVEARTFVDPISMGSIIDTTAHQLHERAIRHLRPMLRNFLSHMLSVKNSEEGTPALTSVSIPQ